MDSDALTPSPQVKYPHGLSLIIPCYNEEHAIAPVLESLVEILNLLSLPWEIILVDDGSTDATTNVIQQAISHFQPKALRLLRLPSNQGYGSALKIGARNAHYDLIAITDADGTYPNEVLPALLAAMPQNSESAEMSVEMVIGARTGKNVRIPWVRRPAKWALTRLANYLTQTRIPDLNSGLRIVRRSLWEKYESLYPDGFSLTTTLTLSALVNQHHIIFIPIDYHARIGRSKIRPISDTIEFTQLILRTVTYFKPMKIFLPVAMLLFILSGMIGFGSLCFMERFMDSTTVLLFISGLQMLAMGTIADLITRRMK